MEIKIRKRAMENQMNVVLNFSLSMDFLFDRADPIVIKTTELVISNI